MLAGEEAGSGVKVDGGVSLGIGGAGGWEADALHPASTSPTATSMTTRYPRLMFQTTVFGSFLRDNRSIVLDVYRQRGRLRITQTIPTPSITRTTPPIAATLNFSRGE